MKKKPMRDYNSLSYILWNYKYHIDFISNKDKWFNKLPKKEDAEQDTYERSPKTEKPKIEVKEVPSYSSDLP